MTWQTPNQQPPRPIPQMTTTSQLWTSTDWAYNRMKSALEEICDLLNPPGCEANECEGCLWEMAEVLRLAQAALGRDFKRPHHPEHRKRETDASDE